MIKVIEKTENLKKKSIGASKASKDQSLAGF